jgi:hypothetical protein
MKFSDQLANNQENGVTKVNTGGRVGFAQITRNDHQFFSDISLTTDNMRTLVSKDGNIGYSVLGYVVWNGEVYKK